MSLQTVLSILGAVGVGGILRAYFQSLFQHKRVLKGEEHELKRRRYGCILILMLTKLDPKTGLPQARKFRQDLKNLDDLKRKLRRNFSMESFSPVTMR